METVTALVVELLGTLRSSIGPAVCPGGWAWAVTALGVGVGLLPAVGALLVSLLRRGVGSHAGPLAAVVLGVISAGVLPYQVITATGRVFTLAADGSNPGFTAQEFADLRQSVCLGRQANYLGRGPVADLIDWDSPVLLGIALVVLVPAPLLVALATAGQARRALRRGPRWPAKYFWIPILVLPFLTTETPVGTAVHLWLGMVAGALLGLLAVLVLAPPPRETVHPAMRRPSPASVHPNRPVWDDWARRLRRAKPAVGDRFAAQQRQRWWNERVQPLADRLEARFAARDPQPLITLPKTDTSPLPPPPAPPGANPPTRVGPPPTLVAPTAPVSARFRLIRRLGDGGFARVWLAHDAKLGQTVALKAAIAPDQETEERIRREAEALAAVRHPHCVRVFDLVHARSDPGLADLDGLVIVMEYVAGSSLGELVRTRGPFDDIAAAQVWVAIAGALDAAHGKGVLHRDIKPGNVVVDNNGVAHLIDFGIARRSGDATLTATGFVIGTPDFLAPEVAAGQRATPASDAWQLAATVSFALTGRPPRGEHEDAVSGLRAAAVGAPLAHLPQHSAHLPLLQAALDNDPSRRPVLADVERTLRSWLHRSGVGPGPLTATLRL